MLLIFTDIRIPMCHILVVQLIQKKDEQNIETIKQINVVGH